MSTDLALIDSGKFSFEEMAALMGQETGGGGNDGLTRLRINTEFEDDDGNPRPGGTWTIKHEGREVFAKTIKLRVLSQRFFYQRYDKKEEKIVNRTIFMRSFKEEPLDEMGTLRCGKPDGKVFKSMSDAEKKKYEDIRARRAVFGLVTFVDPVNADGSAAEPLENVPVEWVSGGASWNLVGDVFDEMTKKKVLMIQKELTIGLKREKSGQTVYYTPIIEVDWAAPNLPMTPAVVETFAVFEGIIDSRNKEVMSKHKAALRTVSKSVPLDDDDASIVADLAGDFDDELNDEIPL